MRKGFTLIERTPSKADGYWLGASPNSANFPFRADSLTLAPYGATGMCCGVTKSREGKPAAMVDYGLYLRHCPETDGQQIAGHLKRSNVATRSQSERQGKRAGRRMTNDRKHRKGCHGNYSWQSRGDSRGEPLFDGRSLTTVGKKMGRSTRSLDGVKGDGMRGRSRLEKSGEDLQGPVAYISELPNSERRWVRIGISPKSEIHSNVLQGVGDGHSTENLRDNKTRREERAISLGCLPERRNLRDCP